MTTTTRKGSAKPSEEEQAAIAAWFAQEAGAAASNLKEQAKAKARKSVVPTWWKRKVGKAGNCGDQFAAALAKALDPDDANWEQNWVAICRANGVDPSRWSQRNKGMRRMNLSNVLRGNFRRGEPVRIGGESFHQQAEAKAA